VFTDQSLAAALRELFADLGTPAACAEAKRKSGLNDPLKDACDLVEALRGRDGAAH